MRAASQGRAEVLGYEEPSWARPDVSHRNETGINHPFTLMFTKCLQIYEGGIPIRLAASPYAVHEHLEFTPQHSSALQHPVIHRSKLIRK